MQKQQIGKLRDTVQRIFVPVLDHAYLDPVLGVLTQAGGQTFRRDTRATGNSDIQYLQSYLLLDLISMALQHLHVVYPGFRAAAQSRTRAW